MAKRRRREEEQRRRLLSSGYVECQNCKELTPPKALRCPHCTSILSRGKKALAVALAVVLIAASVGVYAYVVEDKEPSLPTVIYHAPTGYGVPIYSEVIISFNLHMDTASVESSFSISPHVPGSFSWTGTTLVFSSATALDQASEYTITIGSGATDRSGRSLDSGIFRWFFVTVGASDERRGTGTGSNDFWVTYPSAHPLAGQPVAHPSWVLDALDQRVVMILDHSEGCYPCVQQTAICKKVYDAHSGQIAFFDLLSGQDEPRASEAFAAYDPTGGVHYIPLTIVLTKVKDAGGKTVIGWHSWEGVIDEQNLDSWISDAISHYSENS